METFVVKSDDYSDDDKDHERPNDMSNESREPLDKSTEENSDKDGYYAWLVCGSSYFIQALVVGILHAYGVFYGEFKREFNASSAQAGKSGYSIRYDFHLYVYALHKNV